MIKKSLKKSITVIIAAVFLVMSLTAPLVAWFGLYDFNDQIWWSIMRFLPVLVVLAAFIARKRLHTFWIYLYRTQKVLFFITVVVSVTMVVAATIKLGTPERKILTVCNKTSKIKQAISLKQQTDRLTSTSDLLALEPGKCHNFELAFLRVHKTVKISSLELDDYEALLSNERRYERQTMDVLQLKKSENLMVSEAEDSSTFIYENVWSRAEQLSLPQRIGTQNEETGLVIDSKAQAPFLTVNFSADSTTGEITFSEGGIRRTLEVVNLQPLTSQTTIVYQSKTSEWRTESAKISPGETVTFEVLFQDVKPSVALRSAIRGEVLKWYAGQNEMVDDGDRSTCLSDGGDENRTYFENPVKSQKCKGKQVYFGKIETDFTAQEHEQIILAFNEAEIPMPQTQNGEFDVESAKIKARELGEWFPLRMKHMTRWGESELPYTFCNALNETNGHQMQGVRVTNVCGSSPISTVPLNFYLNENIVSMNGKTIYSPIDIDVIMMEAAQTPISGGVLQPIPYLVKKANGELVKREAVIFHNALYWQNQKTSLLNWLWSALWGLASNAKIENAVWAYCKLSKEYERPLCEWEAKQRIYYYLVMHPTSFFAGRLIGGITLHLLVGKVIGKFIGKSRFMETVSGAAVALSQSHFLRDELLDGKPEKTTFSNLLYTAGEGALIGFATSSGFNRQIRNSKRKFAGR